MSQNKRKITQNNDNKNLKTMNNNIISNGNDFQVQKVLTAVEIILETVEYYSVNPIERRSIKGNMCLYEGPNGQKCAYSRCWKEGVYKPEFENFDAYAIGNPDLVVEEKYKGQSNEFWICLQRLHDGDQFWDKKGLTKIGEDFVNRLIKRFSI